MRQDVNQNLDFFFHLLYFSQRLHTATRVSKCYLNEKKGMKNKTFSAYNLNYFFFSFIKIMNGSFLLNIYFIENFRNLLRL